MLRHKINDGKQTTSSDGHFDGHGSVPVQCKVNCPMQHVEGFTRSHWTPPLVDYLLCTPPVAAWATGKQTTIKNTPTLMVVLMAMFKAVHWQ
jgi:hypothetical protein